MSTKARTVIKNSGIYGLVTILQKCISFFLLPVYTRFLTTTDYGITTVITTIVSFCSIFYMLSLNGAITRYYFKYKDDENKLKEFWGTNILFVMINCVVMTIFLIVTRKFILSPVAKGINFFPYMFLGLISMTLNPVFTIFQYTLVTTQDSKKYGLNNMSYFIVNLILTIGFVVPLRMGAAGPLLASSITDIIFFIYTIFNFFPKIKLTLNKTYLKESLSYSLPLIPHSLAGWTMGLIDRLFINDMIGTAAAGLYNVGCQLGNILNILTAAVNQAFVPWFYQKMDEGKKGHVSVIKFAEYCIIFYCFVAMGISLFGEDVLKILVSKSYAGAWTVVPLTCFAFVFNGIYYFFANPLFYNKKGTRYIPIGTFSGAILNIVLNFYLVPKYSMVGAAIATIVSMAVSSVLILFISNKVEKLNYNYIKIYGITFMFLGISMLSYVKLNIAYYLFFIMKLLVLLIVCGILYFMYKDEFKYIMNVIKKRIGLN